MNNRGKHRYSEKETETTEAETKGEDKSINVKLAASDVPYPTIYKLVSEMESRRDLSEKFERLKILEFEMNL